MFPPIVSKVLCFALTVSTSPAIFAQSAPEALTISRAVAIATERYPLVRVSEEQLAAARGAVNLARTAYLPRVDAHAQINRATHNNVYGLMFPQPVIPPISGPVAPDATWNNVWGSAAGTLVSWEPFDFGLRRANVAVGEAAEKRAKAALMRTRFEVAALAADAYLTLAAAEQMLRAAQAGVERSRVLETMIGAVVNAELRPGVDLSRTRAERAVAETQVAQARQAVEVARATLAQILGMRPAEVTIAPGRLLDPAPSEPSGAAGEHPRAAEQKAAIDEVVARENALNRAFFPRFSVESAAFGRGTGAHPDGTSGGAFSGFGPNTGNWAVGFSVTFPLFDFAQLRVRREIESHNERAEAARLDQVARELAGDRDRALAAYEGARQVAANTPVQLSAARDTERQAEARYKAGLSTAVEVADAQRLLTQAEINDSIARLGVWRAMLAIAAASGNLDNFLDKTK